MLFNGFPSLLQEVINVLKQPHLSMEWDPRIKACTKVTTATNHDAISLSLNCTGLIAQFLHRVRLSFGKEVHAIYSRQVNCSNNQELDAERAVFSVLECTSIKTATFSYPSLSPSCKHPLKPCRPSSGFHINKLS